MKEILVVEDDAGLRETLEECLEERGFYVVSAGTVQGALDRLQQQKEIGILLSDYELPDQTGLELIRFVRYVLKQIEMKCLLMTACELEWDEAFEEELRIFSILKKPFSTKELFGTLRQILDEGGYENGKDHWN